VAVSFFAGAAGLGRCRSGGGGGNRGSGRNSGDLRRRRIESLCFDTLLTQFRILTHSEDLIEMSRNALAFAIRYEFWRRRQQIVIEKERFERQSKQSARQISQLILAQNQMLQRRHLSNLVGKAAILLFCK
jgi:hypothetical protein